MPTKLSPNDFRILQVSSCIKDTSAPRWFFRCYQCLSFLKHSYRNFDEWYWTTAIPGLYSGNMEFFIALKQDSILGILIAENTAQKKKICTLWIPLLWRNRGIASCLIEHAFSYLQTTYPIITFAEHKLPEFQPLLEKYHWKVDGKEFKIMTQEYELLCNTTIQET